MSSARRITVPSMAERVGCGCKEGGGSLRFGMTMVLLLALLGPEVAVAREGTIRSRLEPLVEEIASAVEEMEGPVAVPRFTAAGDAKALEIEDLFTAALVSLLEERKIAVRDPEALEAIADEATLVMLSGGEHDHVSGLGETVGAAGMVMGSLGMLDELLTMDIRVLDVGTGEIRATASGRMIASAARDVSESAIAAEEAIDVALRRLSDDLAKGIDAGVPEVLRYVRAAVVDFEESGEGARRRELGKVVAAEVATVLRRDHGVFLVERGRLREVLDEHRLAMAGIVDASSAVEIGSLLGADLLIFGNVSEVGDQFRINVRAVGTEDAEVVAAAQSSLSASGLVALSSDAVVLRSRSGAVFRSVLIPGWGQFYNQQGTKGAAFIGLEGGLLGAALGFHFAGQSAESSYHDSEDPGGTVHLRERAESRYRTRNVLLVASGGLWLFNIVDAWVFGRSPSADWSGTGLVFTPTHSRPGLALSGTW